ncbi:MAG: EAL domain-containing protein [Spirochaeta sp.]|jgi:EAL domain-containing protein (putative c-di-GMP-specific phosphodiesterase class I)|nr:EAL domain-containing protein [Spirochaeta sp.]
MELCADLKIRLDIASLESYFQPVFNLRTGTVIGVEALLRPRKTTGEHLAPAIVFQEAAMNGCLLDLEREARTVALKTFSAELPDRELMLFLNFSSALLDAGALDPEHILSTVRHFGLAVRNVAVETVESGVRSLDELSQFSRSIRRAGFMISLDNFGTEHSSLERVALVRPDIIKIDRSIIDGIHESPRKRSVLRSIAYLSQTIGALCLAQGLERYEDLEVCAEEGIDLAQGFLLGRPGPTLDAALRRKETTADAHFDVLEQALRDRLRMRSDAFAAIQATVDGLVTGLTDFTARELEAELRRRVADVPLVDAAYILSPDGTQITPTVMTRTRTRPERHPVFHPLPVGTNHRLKDYAYGPGALDHNRFITGPYLSLNSGSVCRTISRKFSTKDGQELILCVDIPEEADQ